MRLLDMNSVLKAVVVPTYAPNGHAATSLLNSELLDVAAEFPSRIVPGIWVDPSVDSPADLSKTLGVASKAGVFVLKMSADVWRGTSTLDPSTWSVRVRRGMATILEYSTAKAGVIQIHTGSGRSDVASAEALMRHADTDDFCLHLVHMGNSVGGHFYLVPRLASWIRWGWNFVIDTSLARAFAVRWLVRCISEHPELAEHVLFASDEPWGSCAEELAKLRDAVEPDMKLQRRILWDNPVRIYGRNGAQGSPD
jgi:predicted TIM-barrel fold metal-dependent hydrolase